MWNRQPENEPFVYEIEIVHNRGFVVCLAPRKHRV